VNEKGVSPVIGVMLMLVVAILLAAAVSTYVGQMQMKRPAPTAVFECKIVKNRTITMGGYTFKVTYMELKEVSGDEIPTKDLEIITYNPDAYGPHKTRVVLPNSMNTHYYTTWGTWHNGSCPYLNNYAYGFWFNNPKTWFGNYTIKPGVTMTADWYIGTDYQAKWNGSIGDYNGFNVNRTIDPNAGNVTGFCACIADGWNVTPGHYITVKVVYIPTHTVIWEKKVLVESGE